VPLHRAGPLLLLTDPAKPRSSVRPVKVSATIGCLKYSRPEYAEILKQTMGPEVDYLRRPSEDFARATISCIDDAGLPLVAEVTTSMELCRPRTATERRTAGPEYS
jgi:hypothetical protein